MVRRATYGRIPGGPNFSQNRDHSGLVANNFSMGGYRLALIGLSPVSLNVDPAAALAKFGSIGGKMFLPTGIATL